MTRFSVWRPNLRPVVTIAACAIALATAGCETPGEPVQTSAPPKSAPPEVPRFPLPVPRPAPVETVRPQPPRPPEAERSLAHRPRATSHVVRSGEDLYGIAAAYGIDAYALATANGLTPPFTVTAGQSLALPTPESAVAAAPLPEAVERPAAATPATRSGDGDAVAQVMPVPRAPTETPAADESGFIWPVNGDIISEFGAKGDGLYNDGINIAASRGTPVRAADGGVVAYAGNELRGFGNMLLIKHPDGWVTAYAHTEEVLVQKGERVGKGQVIARVGSTGSVSRPQLHFELRKGKKAVDPLPYLRRPNA